MTDRRTTLALAAVGVVVLAALLPAMALARPANEIPVTVAADDADYGEPGGDAWSDVPPVDMPLASAPSGLPGADDTSVSTASIQAARTDERLYVRLAWRDATVDDNITDPRSFADAAAVQLPVNTSARPPIAMGSTRNTVNVWFWSADSGTEELYAGGPGSTTTFSEASVAVSQARIDDRWVLVFERPLRMDAENRTQLTLERNVDVAVAVWNGSNMERSGVKSVSEWHHFALGPGPSGPPYESYLWVIAGLAMVVVVFVTVYAARRT